jgi:hypothetical protein
MKESSFFIQFGKEFQRKDSLFYLHRESSWLKVCRNLFGEVLDLDISHH